MHYLNGSHQIDNMRSSYVKIIDYLKYASPAKLGSKVSGSTILASGFPVFKYCHIKIPSMYSRLNINLDEFSKFQYNNEMCNSSIQ